MIVGEEGFFFYFLKRSNNYSKKYLNFCYTKSISIYIFIYYTITNSF